MQGVNRRMVLMSGAAALTLALAGRGVELRAQNGPARIRHEVHSPAAVNMLMLYARAVREMKAKPAWDPTSWWYQANIHWTPSDDPRGCYTAACFDRLFAPPPDAPPETLARQREARRIAAGEIPLDPEYGIGRDRVWVKCPHGLLDFLPWHRAYLHFFELIVESVVGEPFAMPYWNYLDPRFRDMPAPFRDERLADGGENPLYYADRSPLCHNPDDPGVPASDKPLIREIDLNWTAATEQDFLEHGDIFGFGDGFSAQVEGAPHGSVHVRIGRRVRQTDGSEILLGMATPELAARDPIFWLHHANLDRLWEWWRRQQRPDGRPRDPAWAWSQEPYVFVGADPASPIGLRKVGLSAVETLDMVGTTVAYDTLEPVPSSGGVAAFAADGGTRQPRVVGRSVALATDGGAANATFAPVPSPPAPPGASVLDLGPTDAGRRWFLRFADMRVGAMSGGSFEVFLDPPGASPPTGRPAGSLSFFGVGGSGNRLHSGHGVAGEAVRERLIDVTARVRELAVQGADPGSLQITVRRIGAEPPIRIGTVELIAR